MRIRLISTTDPITTLKAGDEGEVLSTKQSNWLGFIDYRLEVQWDNGSTLALYESQDRWEVISEQRCLTTLPNNCILIATQMTERL